MLINSDTIKSIRVLKTKNIGTKQNLDEIKTFKELIKIQGRLGGFDL